ncbi:ribonuclease domain-containing protein [Corynebacterium sp.]|uniref:ribonuclease domain-containing protein n=1 Tax=Corynebacterium sp. TaxID=1720 RepID=UPI003B3B285F
MSTRNNKVVGSVAGAAVILVAGYFGLDAVTGDDTDAGNGGGSSVGDTCAVSTLPDQADDVINSILDDGDFAHPDHDGKHFGNYEGLLPDEPGSYYREYTVSTPGLDHRGARRIVVGGGTDTDPDVWYYTADHYGSFCSIPDAED